MPRQRQEVEKFHKAWGIVALAAVVAASAVPDLLHGSRGTDHAGKDEATCTFLACPAYAKGGQKGSQSSKSGRSDSDSDRDRDRDRQRGLDADPQRADRTEGSQSPDDAARQPSNPEQQDADGRRPGTTADSQRPRTAADGRRAGTDSTRPPATLLDMFKWLSAPRIEPGTNQQKSAAPAAHGATKGAGHGAWSTSVVQAAPKPQTSQKAQPRPLTTASPRQSSKLPYTSPAGPPSALPAFADREILAHNLSPASLEQAQRLGFRVRSSQPRDQLGGSVTQLATPAGMDAPEARRILQLEIPHSDFSFNTYYHLYRPAGRKDGSPDPEAGRCATERCFAPSIIRWRDQLGICADGLPIGVVDTGFERDHPAFGNRLAHYRHGIETNIFRKVDERVAPNTHGTGVLALLSGDKSSSTPGLIPGARFYVADIFFAGPGGMPISDTINLLKALEWLERSNVKIINLSLMGDRDDPLVRDKIAELSRKGVIFVAAAGNGGPSASPSYPAAYDQVIAVTAVNSALRGYRYANHGDYIDVAAPGVAVWTALPNRSEGPQTGTSFAVPHVTSVLATMYGTFQDKDKHSILQRLVIQDLGPPGKDRIYGRGLVLAPQSCSQWTPVANSSASPVDILSANPTKTRNQ